MALKCLHTELRSLLQRFLRRYMQHFQPNRPESLFTATFIRIQGGQRKNQDFFLWLNLIKVKMKQWYCIYQKQNKMLLDMCIVDCLILELYSGLKKNKHSLFLFKYSKEARTIKAQEQQHGKHPFST